MNKRDLKKLRASGEHIYFFLGLLLGVVIIFYVVGVSLYVSLGLIIFALATVILVNSSLIGSSLLITHKSLPKVHTILDKTSKKLGIKTPKLYIQQSPELSAFTIGISNPSVVLTSGLYEVLDDEELEFVIGHEYGHILFHHNIATTFLYPAGKQIPYLNYFNDFWSRKTEYTADRIGLFCSGDIDKSISALSKIAVGTKAFASLGKNYFMSQKEDIDSLAEKLGETLSNHPYTVNRIAKLISFNSKNSKSIINDY